jgi:hypothetical protein
MGARDAWVCFLACPGEAAACPVAAYLNLHDCPALVFPVPPGVDFSLTAEVRVPAELLMRARHIWAHAGTVGDVSEGELEYLATGKLPGQNGEQFRRDDAA